MKHETLEAALVAAQAEMPGVQFDAVNPFLKNKYASLGAVIKTAQPILANHGLAFMQMVKSDEVGRVGVETTLLHESGKSISSVVFLPLNLDAKSIAQDAGSIITYLRRYSLAAMLGMYADEDVDGSQQKAQSKAPETVTPSMVLDQLTGKSKPKAPEAKPEPAQPKMSLESAMAVMGSDNVTYGNKDTATLSHMHNQIVKQLKLTDLPSEKREEYEFKRDAIATILANRK